MMIGNRWKALILLAILPLASCGDDHEDPRDRTATPVAQPTTSAIFTPTTDPQSEPTQPMASASIIVESVVAARGDRVEFVVRLASGGLEVAGIEMNLSFDPDLPIAIRANGRADCTVNGDIPHAYTGFGFTPHGCQATSTCTGIHAIVISQSFEGILTDSGELFRCVVNIPPASEVRSFGLPCSGPGASDRSGEEIPAVCRSGEIVVHGGPASTATWTALPTRTRTVTPTLIPTRPPPRLLLGSSSAMRGDTITIGVSLSAPRSEVVGIENELVVRPPLRIKANSDGKPVCRANGAIQRRQTGFSFHGSTCAADPTCSNVKAIVLDHSDLSPIPDGSLLYECDVEIDATAMAGRYPIQCANPGAGDSIGNRLEIGCTSGSVEVLCIENCPTEREVVWPLAGESGAAIQTALFAIPLPFSGEMRLRLETVDSHGVIPLSMRTEDLAIAPIAVPGLICVCVRAIVDDDLGAGLAVRGKIGCGPDGLPDVDYTCTRDHNTNDVDPSCERGTPDVLVAGVCNGPLECRFTGGGPTGSMVLETNLSMGIIQDGGLCIVDPTDPAKGLDGIPCTSDDPAASLVATRAIATTGRASATIYDSHPIITVGLDTVCGPNGSRPVIPCGITVQGHPVRCEADGNIAFGDAILVTAYPVLNADQIGDSIITTHLSCGTR